MSKPITLYSHGSGPNPWKVAIVLEELGIPYETEFVDMSIMHTPEFEKHNPNGRVPAIVDPNNNITLWESGAIIQYLVDKYDTSNRLSFANGTPDKYYADQWLHFQTSGQGPYFGQGAWFANFHSEKLPSAIDRYRNEIKRVTKVLDGQLAGKEYLVGGKLSYADLSFVPWYWLVPFIDKQGGLREELDKECPNWSKWEKGMNARTAVKKMYDERASKMSH
ncbi:MAG: glutathione S- transferase, nitrogen catabolite repression regulator [Stictis urceolatum]|nr:glutathione S- transferase, nitrogen catabolite repression regulator [Stictis urceolata]